MKAFVPTGDSERVVALVALVAEGHLHPEIGLLEDWAQTAEVLRQLRGRGVRGNAVLKIPKA